MTMGSATGIDVHDIDLDEPAVTGAHELDTVSTPPPLVLVVFGASGDLAARKLLPAIASLADHDALPEAFTVVGVARTHLERRGVPGRGAEGGGEAERGLGGAR